MTALNNMVVNRLHGKAHSRHKEVHAVPTNSAGEPADFQGSVGGLHQKSLTISSCHLWMTLCLSFLLVRSAMTPAEGT